MPPRSPATEDWPEAFVISLDCEPAKLEGFAAHMRTIFAPFRRHPGERCRFPTPTAFGRDCSCQPGQPSVARAVGVLADERVRRAAVKQGLIAPSRASPPLRGRLGCALAHLTLWERVAASGTEERDRCLDPHPIPHESGAYALCRRRSSVWRTMSESHRRFEASWALPWRSCSRAATLNFWDDCWAPR